MTVVAGEELALLGQVDGNVIVEEGGWATIDGTVTKDVINNGGFVAIRGLVKGTVHRRAGTLWEMRPGWMADGLCAEYPDVTWFPERGESTAPAKQVCSRCLVKPECLAFAMAERELVGVWGGTSPRERARLRAGKVAAPAA